ncbi:MAG: DNA polymerase III subunit beta [Candidatus Pacebacteria bacterium]|nr:DNA polymerase III subunit beta [Candidatus Paceibacterota bacterium]PIR64198.1 MAG: DNA polymerase III subunit beta [Candidatus Pacebacteria bacterium CG10_big_fil_rev_8_21_14_0_10_40_26]PIZ79277.1 MAG: DNA polymerase III subunit beta [Candidatus Pacebacteria bacterium CG_4_10_14_0_2_um_filter_40_20]PJA68933.1 MAG: DNA polymerase III subunit beta [Candidatus Pacebacteria bacterium CG_4_9_14_3_um_filter_40_12]PJC42244.1 MAG: DNA polymerase III subunit beta [Candidatus Pacebacteria bacterium 
MKTYILQENLNKGLSYLSKAIPSNPQLPVLSSVLFEATTSGCVISATDLYFGVRVHLQASVETEGTIVIPGKQFKELISSMGNGKLTLEFIEGTLNILSEHSKTKLQCQAADEYPQFPQVEGETYTFDTEQLQSIEQFVGFSASTDQARPVLTSILFEPTENGLLTVTTDGFRLSTYKVANAVGRATSTLLLQSKALHEVNRIVQQVSEKTVSFVVSQELKQVYFASGDVEIYMRLIEGEYPPYQKIIPSVFTTEVTFSSGELDDNIKRALIFARDISNIIKFSIEADKVTISASSPSLGTYSGEIPGVKITGEPLEIAFNAKYVQDILKATKSDSIWFGMSESLKPVLCKVTDVPEAEYVIMPFKVNG